jgi:signal transduction histidine kinase
LNMQRRLEHMGGTCSVQSEPGRGTTVVLRANIQSTG